MKDTFVVTNAWLHMWRSHRGGWNRAQLAALGIEWPPRRRWAKHVIGTTITTLQRDRFEREGSKDRCVLSQGTKKQYWAEIARVRREQKRLAALRAQSLNDGRGAPRLVKRGEGV